jgi:hypothetical protein
VFKPFAMRARQCARQSGESTLALSCLFDDGIGDSERGPSPILRPVG